MPELRQRVAKTAVAERLYPYEITQALWKGKNNDGKNYQSKGRYGDFRETKEYNIVGKVPANGIVVQYINKKTKVEVAEPVDGAYILDTSAAIEKLTSGNVKYMCDSYFEYFEIKNNKSVVGDQFQNGAVAPYYLEKKKWLPETDNAIDVSRGAFLKADGVSRDGVGIVQTGLNVFIPDGPDATAIRNMRWSDLETLPANGLPYLPFSEALWETFKSKSQSAVFMHKIEVAWGYKKAATSVVISYPAVAGGKRKTLRKRKTATKRTIKY